VIAVIVQARMGASRLPGKTLADIAGEPMLGHVVRRAQSITGINRVIIATTKNPADIAIIQFAEAAGMPVHVGSEQDVLDRFYRTAKHFGVSVIVRVTPDCPQLDPCVASLVLDRFLRTEGTLDYVSNVHPPTFPDGLDTEVFSLAALARAWSEAQLPSEREHVTPYIWKNPGKFRIANVSHDPDLSRLRWTVDELQDLTFVRRLYDYLGSKAITKMDDTLAVLREHPELSQINVGIERNDGYRKSLQEDNSNTSKRIK